MISIEMSEEIADKIIFLDGCYTLRELVDIIAEAIDCEDSEELEEDLIQLKIQEYRALMKYRMWLYLDKTR
jgi:hypothetical protein